MLSFLFVALQLGLKANPPPIQEKPAKSNKKAPPTKEELCKMTVSLFKALPMTSYVMCYIWGLHSLIFFYSPLIFKGDTTHRLPKQQKC